MRFLITDIKRGLTERTFYASIALGVVCVILSLVMVMQSNPSTDGLDLFLGSQSLILPFIAPLLAALPYANMSMLEADCGYQRLMMSKNNMKPYRVTRWFVSSMLSGIAISVPLILLAVVSYMITPFENFQGVAQIIGLDFLFGFSYGSICYGLTFVNKKRYIPTVTPQVVYLLFIYAFPYLNLEAYYPPLSFSPWLLANNVDGTSIMIQFAVLNGIAILLMVAAILKDQIKRVGKID